MSAEKYLSIFWRQMEAIVYIPKFWVIHNIPKFGVYLPYTQILGISTVFRNSAYIFQKPKFWLYPPYTQILGISFVYLNSRYIYDIPKFWVIHHKMGIYPKFGYIFKTPKFWVCLPYTQIMGKSFMYPNFGKSTIHPNLAYILLLTKF